jgi:hypothetical protein
MPAADARRRCADASRPSTTCSPAPLTSRRDLRGDALRRKAREAMTSRLDRAA